MLDTLHVGVGWVGASWNVAGSIFGGKASLLGVEHPASKTKSTDDTETNDSTDDGTATRSSGVLFSSCDSVESFTLSSVGLLRLVGSNDLFVFIG